MRQIFVSEGNSIGPYSNYLPGSFASVEEAEAQGAINFPEEGYILWENDEEGTPQEL